MKLAAALVMLLSAPATLHASPAEHPNVLVVLMDDVGYWDLAYSGAQDPAHTPTLDSLAQRGASFTHCWAMPICSPTRATLLTGTYPFRHGLGESVGQQGAFGLALTGQLPAHLGGYATAFFGKWHVSAVATTDPLDAPGEMGFDWYEGHWWNLLNQDVYTSWPKFRNGVDLGVQTDYATSDEFEDTRRWIHRQHGPWFALLSLTAAHSPYHVPPAELAAPPDPDEGDRGLFKAAIEAVDTELGALVAALPANTIVVIVGDNGSPDLVRPPELKTGKAKNQPYEGGIRVPLIVVGPGIRRGTFPDLVGVVDLWATVIELAGHRPPASGVDSVSLAPLLRTGAPFHKPFQYTERYTGNGLFPNVKKWRRALSDGTWKLVEIKGERELYDLGSDPFEKKDLYGDPQHAAIQARLEAQLDGLTR